MSAIAGIVHGTTGADSHIRAMTAALAARGPDGEGAWSDNGVALGQRLLVPDGEAAEAVPAVSASGRYVLIFDGEIHNAPSLRRDMESAGQAPERRGTSDAAMLAELIEAHGLDAALSLVAGPFALALWDRKERWLSLARDRMGVRPLYWGGAGEAFVFGSELKALRQHPGFQGGISREALTLFLRFGVVPAPWSIHPGVFKLEPGCILELRTDAPPPA